MLVLPIQPACTIGKRKLEFSHGQSRFYRSRAIHLRSIVIVIRVNNFGRNKQKHQE